MRGGQPALGEFDRIAAVNDIDLATTRGVRVPSCDLSPMPSR
jgi:hypothetical protein